MMRQRGRGGTRGGGVGGAVGGDGEDDDKGAPHGCEQR